jgi:hypothetical protein
MIAGPLSAQENLPLKGELRAKPERLPQVCGINKIAYIGSMPLKRRAFLINARKIVAYEWIILLNRNICRNPNELFLRIRSIFCRCVLDYPVYVNAEHQPRRRLLRRGQLTKEV